MGLISKVNVSFLVAIAGLGIIYQVMVSRERKVMQKLIRMVRNLALLLVPIALISGWFFVRSVSIYGRDDPLGWKLQAIQNPDLVMPGMVRAQVLKYALAPRLFTSFWGQFDWLTIRLPSWAYWIYGLISLMGLIGVGAGIYLTRSKREKKRGIEWMMKRGTACVLLYLAAIALAAANIIILNFSFFADQGRLIFPVIAPLCIFMALGIYSGLSALSRLLKIRHVLLVYSFILLLIGLNLYSLIGIVYPIYR